MKTLLFSLVISIFSQAAAQSEEPVKRMKLTPEMLTPFWESNEMHGESVLFIKAVGDKLANASVMFPPTKILSVKDASGKITYEEGRDFVLIPGTRKIELPAGSRIISKTTQELRVPDDSQKHKLSHVDGNGEIMFGATDEYHVLQTVISYAHKDESDWKGIRPTFAGKQLPKTIQKLKAKQALKVVLFGDSISTGCNASSWAKAAPWHPTFQDMLVENLKKSYQTEVSLANLSVGGMSTPWGLKTIDDVIKEKPDLVIISFGMNDAVGRPAKEYKANTKGMIDAVRKANPDAEVILVSTMLGNKDWYRMKMDLFPQFRVALTELSGNGVALADMTSMWDEMLKKKAYLDITGNGVNHPNDFGHRVYAQVLSALLIPKTQ